LSPPWQCDLTRVLGRRCNPMIIAGPKNFGVSISGIRAGPIGGGSTPSNRPIDHGAEGDNVCQRQILRPMREFFAWR
jgi:hypothetical protein